MNRKRWYAFFGFALVFMFLWWVSNTGTYNGMTKEEWETYKDVALEEAAQVEDHISNISVDVLVLNSASYANEEEVYDALSRIKSESRNATREAIDFYTLDIPDPAHNAHMHLWYAVGNMEHIGEEWAKMPDISLVDAFNQSESLMKQKKQNINKWKEAVEKIDAEFAELER